jgi:hypothetical protein
VPADLSEPEYTAYLTAEHRQALQGMVVNPSTKPTDPATLAPPPGPYQLPPRRPRDEIVATSYATALQQIPAPLLRMLNDGGVKIYLGAGMDKITDLDDEQHAENDQPRGWPQGSKMWETGGYYTPGKKYVLVGNGRRDGSRSVLIHEVGHAIGDVMRVDGDPELRAHHSRLKDGLSPYYSGAAHFDTSFDPNRAGIQELWAESVAVYLAAGGDHPADASGWRTQGFETLIYGQHGIGKLDPRFAAWVEDRLRQLQGLPPIDRPDDALLTAEELATQRAKASAIDHLEAAPLGARIAAGETFTGQRDFYLRVEGGWQLWTRFPNGHEQQIAARTIPSEEIALWFIDKAAKIET